MIQQNLSLVLGLSTGLLKFTQSLSIVFQLQFTPQLVNTVLILMLHCVIQTKMCQRINRYKNDIVQNLTNCSFGYTATFLMHYLNRWWTLKKYVRSDGK